MNGETAAKIIERWGFPVLVALATGWILRNDVLVPLVEEHRVFVRQLGDTQKEIGEVLKEQAKILHQLVPDKSEKK